MTCADDRLCPEPVLLRDAVDAVLAVYKGVSPSPLARAVWLAARLSAERRSFALDARIPTRITDLWWSGRWRETDASRRAVAMVRTGTRQIVLWGQPGTGKSCAAAQVLLEPAHHDADGEPRFVGLWVSAAEYCDCDLAPGRRDNGLIRDAQAAYYLVVDDVGEEAERDSGRIARLLTDRYDSSHQVTICTTNLDGRGVLARYGRRVGSRLKEVGGAIECREVVRPGEVQR